MKKKLRFIFNVFFWLVIAVFIVIVILRIAANNGYQIPVKSYIVQSGSMEPSIMTGDVVLIKPETEYQVKDVVTYRDKQARVVTHRIIEIQENSNPPVFQTKGDANQVADPDYLSQEQIAGKVFLVLPRFGFLATFSKSKMGIIILLVIPATIIVYDELRSIFR